MDISKLLPEHQNIMQDFISDKFGVGYTEEYKQKMYNIYLALADIPEKDWGKQSTVDALQEIDNV